MDRRFSALYLSAVAFFVLRTSSCLSMTVATTSTTPTPCFQCQNSKACINVLLRCDGLDDCGDYSDEKNCSCGAVGKFKCDNGRCIPNTWVCDFEDDCYDNSDERNCNASYFCTGRCDHLCDVVRDTNGMPAGKCRCRDGYYLRPDGTTCVDIDECTKKGICERKCVNTLGSYKCECGAGFTKSDDSKSCNDINECDLNNGGCEHLCQNTYGSYNCACKIGYLPSYRNKKYCQDIDECALGIPNCHSCKNVAGGFKCDCDSGYYENANKTACYDRDECSKNNGGCEHICKNLPGSYVCVCKPGFQALHGNFKSCRDINECARNNGKGPCEYKCTNTRGHYRCTCPPGFIISKDGHNCDDINECKRKGTCDHICFNTPGSFYCDCRDGFFLAKDKKTCRDTVDYSVCGSMDEKIEETRRWKDTNKNVWPWIVYFTTTFHFWSIIDQFPLQGVLGIILNEKWVLTAGHSLGDESYNVHTNDGNSIGVSEIIPYSTCDVKAGQCKSDIALVKLVTPIKFTQNVRPICLPTSVMQESFVGNRSEPGMILRRPSGLQKRTVRVRRPKDCTHYPFSKHMICAGDLRNVCAADSGSPLMFTRKIYNDNRYTTKNNKSKDKYIAYLAGVSSWGTDILDGDDEFAADDSCDSHPRFLAYTNIVRYLKWIQDKTGTTPYS